MSFFIIFFNEIGNVEEAFIYNWKMDSLILVQEMFVEFGMRRESKLINFGIKLTHFHKFIKKFSEVWNYLMIHYKAQK